MRQFILLFVGFVSLQAMGQISGKVIDAATGEPIPYANIQAGTKSMISNTEGFFTVAEAADDAPIVISYIGYAPVQITTSVLRSGNNTVKLSPAMFELDEVKVRERPTPEAIIAAVRKNLNQNYLSTGKSFETKIFMRESDLFAPKKMDIIIDKSTGFTKNNLKSFNSELGKFTARAVNNPAKVYTDVLFNYYGAADKKSYKIDVVKAAKLMDRNKSTSLDELQGTATTLFLKHLDTTKYYRVKSGWFGSRDTITLRKDFKNGKKKAPKTELNSLKSSLAKVSTENSLFSKEFEFIHDPEIYEYKTEGSVLLPDGNFAYVVSFKPDRNRAIYTGKLYITEGDFAVIRADYALAEGKKAGGMNMKLLLGVKVAENLKSGTIIFRQRPSGEGYYLQYASNETGQYLYLNRPLKFIELAESEKDVVAFDLKIEGNMYHKTEYLNLARNDISDADFESAKENEFKYATLTKYDPAMWKNEGAIEPLEEMKRFKASEEPQ